MVKNYKGKTKEEKKLEIETLIKNAEDKIESYSKTPQDIKELVDFMSRFYDYSLRNSMLINDQFNGAFAVGSFAFWKEKGFQVKKGEKGIKILVPTKLGDRFENEKGEIVLVSKATKQEKEKLKKGELKFIAGRTVFKQGYVFDISQTNAKNTDLPKIFPNRWLEGKVENYNVFYNGLVKIAENNNIKIIDSKGELGVAKGVSYTLTKEIAVNKRNSELQNIKTLLHELTHAKLHRADNSTEYTRNEKEFQAELTAYTVSNYFGIDTGEYSINYISEWTKNVELKNKIKLLNEVRETAKEFIEVLESELIENKKELLKTNSSFSNEKKVNYFDVEKLKEIPIKDVCEYLGLELKRGSNNKLWTKIRNEHTRSCCINIEENYWFDFGLGYGGDTIKLVEVINKVNSKEAMKELAERFGIDGEIVDNKFYLSKSDYDLIGIQSDRATLNLDINLEKQSIDELKEIEKIYGKSMNELANDDREKFLEIVENISLPILVNDRERLNSITLAFKEMKNNPIYYGMVEAVSKRISKRVDILEKVGFKDECKEVKELNLLLGKELREDMKNIDINKDNIMELNYFELKKDLNLEDGTKIKKGTEFVIDRYIKEEDKYEIHFEESKNNVYHNEFGDNYNFNINEIKDFAKPTEYAINKIFDKESLNNVLVDVKSSELKEIPKQTYKFKDINRELEIKEAIIRDKKEIDFFPSLKLKMNIEDIENEKNFEVKFIVGDGKTNDLIEEIELLDNENAKEFLKKYDKELKKIGHNKYEQEIIEKVEAHEEWLRSKGQKGECLDLSYKKLNGIEIVNKDLRGANFKGSEFQNCIIYADLSNANLENIKVNKTKFTGSKFVGAKLNTSTLDIIDTQIKEENIKHFIKENNLKTKEVKKMNLQFE